MPLIAQALRAAIIAVGITIAGTPVPLQKIFAYNGPRDTWYSDPCFDPCEDTDSFEDEDSVDGVASWFDATRNLAWYTQDTKWGNPVKFYGAAGPRLRRFIERLYSTDIGGSAYWQRLAASGERPVLLITSRKTGKQILVTVTDWCGCRGGSDKASDDKVIDLSPEAFTALGLPLGNGIMRITIEPVQ